jgi:hypothetical protein
MNKGKNLNPHPALVFLIAFAVLFGSALAWTMLRGSSLSDPPAPWNVDGVFYDNIAFNLNAGDGFVVDLNAEPWRESYVEANKNPGADSNYSWLFPVKGTGPTALRSPVYPYALSGIYRAFGHRYNVARIFGCLFVGIGLALMVAFCAGRFGLLAATLATATMTIDFSVMQSAGTLATESLAVLILAVTFLLVVQAWEQPNHGRWILAGASFSALMLTRGIWSLGWLILIAVSVLCLIPAIRSRWETLRMSHFFVFLATAMIVALPWWIRNCQTTGHFTPFGTAGSCGFVGAYCDESLANYGQWQPDVYNRNQIEVQKNFDMDTVDLAELEHATGQSSMEKAKSWCLENWSRIPELMFFRCLSHWGMFNPSVPWIAQAANLWLIGIGLVGCFLFSGKLRGVFVCVLLLDMLLVMLTWEHLGRYAIPVRPIVHVGYGIAMSKLLMWIGSKFKREG